MWSRVLVSVMLCSKLSNKIDYINKKILPKHDCVVLLETHIFKEDLGLYLEAFPGFEVMIDGDSKSKVYTDYRYYKETEELNNNKDSNTLFFNINEHSVQATKGVMLLLCKGTNKLFTRKFVIPEGRSITLQTTDYTSHLNTMYHFIYAPSQHQEATNFWDACQKALNNTNSTSHWIIGDLNSHLNKYDTTKGTTNPTKALKHIIKKWALVDFWRCYSKHNATSTTPTFIRPNIMSTSEINSSRIDYFLGPPDHLPLIKSINIEDFNKNISADHCAITCTIQLPSEHLTKFKRIKPGKTMSYNLPESAKSDEFKAYAKEVIKNLRHTNIDHLIELDNWTYTHTDEAFNTLLSAIEYSAKETFGVKYKRPGVSKPNIENNSEIYQMNKYISKLTRAVMSRKLALQERTIPKAIYKLSKLPFSNITNLINELDPISPNYKTQMKNLIAMCNTAIYNTKLNINTAETRIKNNYISKCVEQIRESCNSIRPSKFFAKCVPSSIYPNQQLHAVNTINPITLQKDISADGETVRSTTVKIWKGIMSSKGTKPTNRPSHLFTGHSFQAAKLKITNNSDLLLQTILGEEVKQTLKKLANHKQAGPDRLPNECFKHLADNEYICNIIAQILTEFLHGAPLPQSWKNSNLFLIYKNGDANDPNNYCPIALLNSFNKIYTALINE